MSARPLVLVLVALAALLLGGCGSSEGEAGTSGGTAPQDARQIAVAPRETTPTATTTTAGRGGEAARRVRVPILMYHVIAEASVRKLLRAGWELGGHTATHPDLRTLDAAGLRRELDDVRTELRRRFDVPVNAFCYPAGKYDPSVIDAVRAAGYTTATTVDPGWAGAKTPRFELPRVRVDPVDTPAGLVEKIAGQRG